MGVSFVGRRPRIKEVTLELAKELEIILSEDPPSRLPKKEFNQSVPKFLGWILILDQHQPAFGVGFHQIGIFMVEVHL